MNEEELSDALHASKPPQPDVTGWADAGRGRARNRRIAVGAVAVLLGLGIALPTILQIPNGTGPVVLATPVSAEPTAMADPLIPAACIDAATSSSLPVDGDLPEGAVRAWLCGADARDAGGGFLLGAPDPLMTNVDMAIREFNAMEKSEGLNIDCQPRPQGYMVRFDYPDGTHRLITMGPCGDLRGGLLGTSATYRADGPGYLKHLAELWNDERTETRFEFTGTGGLCETMISSVWQPLDLADVSRVVACTNNDQDSESREVVLSPELVDKLLVSLREDVAAQLENSGNLSDWTPLLVLLTPTGDPISAIGQAEQWGSNTRDRYALFESGQDRLWSPPMDLVREIQAAVEAANPDGQTSPSAVPSLASERGDGLVPNVCADVQSGKVVPGDLGRTEFLEPGAARVWLCGDLNEPFGGAIGPIEPLTTDPDRVVEAINALPETTGGEGCFAVGGLTYHLVIDYPDGERRVIAAETVNCEFVGGWDGRTGGRELLETLKGFWDEQRDVAPPFTDDVNLCGTYPTGYESGGGRINSFLPVQRGAVTRGVVCGLAADSTDFTGATIQRDLPQELVDAIATASLPSKKPYTVPLGLPYVVLLTEHGDPVTYAVDEDLAIILQDGMLESAPWQPQGDVAALWRGTLDGLRTEAFYSSPAECSEDYTQTADADLDGIVAGWACVDPFAIPAKGPTLDPAFAGELGRRFNAEAVPATTGSFNTVNELRLRDGEGNLSPLSWNGLIPVTFVDDDSKRAWTVPDDVVEELRRYGLRFGLDD